MTKKSTATTPGAKVPAGQSLPPQPPTVRLPLLPLPVTGAPGVLEPEAAPAQRWFLALGPMDTAAFDTVLDRLLASLDTEVTLYALGPGQDHWQDVAQVVLNELLEPPAVHAAEAETRHAAALALGITSHAAPPQVTPPPLPPKMPSPAPSALRASKMHMPGMTTNDRDERTPTKPVPLELIVDSKSLSSLLPEDPTTEIEVPSPHAEHANLAHDLADLDIDDTSLPRQIAAITLPPTTLEAEMLQCSTRSAEAAGHLERQEPNEEPEPSCDSDAPPVAPPAVPPPPPVAAQIVVEAQAEIRRESEPSISFLLEPEGQITRDREQSASVSLAIQRITGLDLEELMANTMGKSNKRVHERYRITTSVNLTSEHNFWTGLTQDLSTGGIFVATYANLPLGCKVLLSVSLPDQSPKLEIKAEVRWLRVMREDLGQTPGMGLRFVDLPPAAKKRIERFLQTQDSILYEE